MRCGTLLLLATLALFAAWLAWHGGKTHAPDPPAPVTTAPRQGQTSVPIDASAAVGDALPREAIDALRRIDAGGPFPHRQDGAVFQNRERLLPQHPRGYYREYTVTTPHARDRGARRIVVGGDPPREIYYSSDHYRSFRRIDRSTGRTRE